jgi:hypothetical protein
LRVLDLVTCSIPINSLEAFWGVTLGFFSHVFDTSQLSVLVHHCPSLNTLYPLISLIYNFLYNWVNFKFW